MKSNAIHFVDRITYMLVPLDTSKMPYLANLDRQDSFSNVPERYRSSLRVADPRLGSVGEQRSFIARSTGAVWLTSDSETSRTVDPSPAVLGGGRGARLAIASAESPHPRHSSHPPRSARSSAARVPAAITFDWRPRSSAGMGSSPCMERVCGERERR